VESRCGAVVPGRLATLCTRGFSSFVTSTALIATGCSEPVPGRVSPAVDQRLFMAHPVTRLYRPPRGPVPSDHALWQTLAMRLFVEAVLLAGG
jgi:hypothetical protein